MKPTKILALMAMSFCLIATPAEARGNNKGQAEAKKRKEERAKKRQDREQKREAIDDFLKPLDKNKDGSLTIDEFLAGESDKEEGMKKFQSVNKNGDRTLTRSEIEALLGIK